MAANARTGPAPEFSPPSYEKFQLSNGIEVTFIRASKVPITHMQINAYSGHAQEPSEKEDLRILHPKCPWKGQRIKVV